MQISNNFKQVVLFFSFLMSFVVYNVEAQIIYEELESSNLNTKRSLKISLPKNYDDYSDVKYPVIIVFDGDYLFEPVIGQVAYQTYFDDMPSAIVVGLVQGKDREYDGFYDDVTGLPRESGLRFHKFIAEELLPYIDYNYNTSPFRVAVGHDLMGNFINSFLFKPELIFNAYVSLSPDLIGTVQEQIGQRLQYFENDIFYYMATSDNDLPYIRDVVLSANDQIKNIENQNLTYYFDDFKNETHYTLVPGAITRAFDKIFELYKPIREKELEEKVKPFEGTLDTYLLERYKRIEDLFGIVKPISFYEFDKMIVASEAREDLESYEKLAKLAKKMYPESMLGNYYLATHAEKTEDVKKAIKLYEEALLLEEVDFINPEDIINSKELLETEIQLAIEEKELEKAEEKAKKEEEKVKRKAEKEQEKREREQEKAKAAAEKQKAKEAKEAEEKSKKEKEE